MTDICILVADNDPDALAIYREFLTSLGYKVLTASSVSVARQTLNTSRVHLAIFDLRLTDDTDEADRSGLTLAQGAARSIPKLILTKWPTYQDVRDAMKMDDALLPPAVDFLNKSEGLKKIGEAVAQTVERYVRINRNLLIQQNEAHPVTFPHLASLLVSHQEADFLQRDAEELDDLFRRLFYEMNQIKLDCILWQHGGRVALRIFAFAEEQAPESFIVVCGQQERIEEEAIRYDEFAPKAVGHSGTALSRTSETQRFAANAYALAGADLENVQTLKDLYNSSPERSFNTALTNLFEKTLAEWHQQSYLPNNERSLVELYCEGLRLDEGVFTSKALKKQINLLVHQIPALGVEADYDSNGLKLQFGGQTFLYPDPVPVLKLIAKASTPVILIKTSGLLSGNNILTDLNGNTWLTDFSTAGFAPQLWNFTSLEAAIRFDWIEMSKLQWLHGMEQYLTGDEFNLMSPGDLEPPLRKPTRTIRLIRRLAARRTSKNYTQYHLGILLHAVQRLMDFDITRRLTTNELSRLAHVLLATVMICGKLKDARHSRSTKAAPEKPGICVDEKNQTVTVDGVRVPMRGQSYNLLRYLFIHQNGLCSRRALVEQVIGERYDELDTSQIARLNTAIRRLREKIETDPDHPRFLHTEPQGGYRLVNPSDTN
jgi:DNA-binding response OmpR family regulator